MRLFKYVSFYTNKLECFPCEKIYKDIKLLKFSVSQCLFNVYESGQHFVIVTGSCFLSWKRLLQFL